MKIYTKTGDDGSTGLFAGSRVPKDHPRIAAYGSVDELNALLGIAIHHAQVAYSQIAVLASPPIGRQAATSPTTIDDSVAGPITQNSSLSPVVSAYASGPSHSVGMIAKDANLIPRPEDEACMATIVEALQRSQSDLFSIGAELATPKPAEHGNKLITEADHARLEGWIDDLEQRLDPLTNFIIPGGSLLAAWLHWARTVCRRAERDVVHLTHQADVEDCTTVVVYLNRLSDLLFVMARAANQSVGVHDVPWRKP